MQIEAMDHVAVRLPDLQEAERFYCQLFGARVLFREAKLADGWATFPPGAEWEEICRSEFRPDLCFLQRDNLKLALERLSGEPESKPGLLSHVCVRVDPEGFEGLRQAAIDLGCEVLVSVQKTFVFADPFGVRWEVTWSAETRSTGERTGRWVAL